jgi:hypothetical protein
MLAELSGEATQGGGLGNEAAGVAATNLWVDNSGAVAVANDARSIGRSRHIARRARFLLELHHVGAIRLRYLPGEDQAADLLTKPLARARFVRLRAYLMGEARQVHSSSSSEDSTDDAGGEQPGLLQQIQSAPTEFGPHNSTDANGEAEAEVCARCTSPSDSGSPFATQWRAAVETEMEAITRAGTFLYTYQGGANNRTTIRTRWVWSSPEPRLQYKQRMVLHGA